MPLQLIPPSESIYLTPTIIFKECFVVYQVTTKKINYEYSQTLVPCGRFSTHDEAVEFIKKSSIDDLNELCYTGPRIQPVRWHFETPVTKDVQYQKDILEMKKKLSTYIISSSIEYELIPNIQPAG